MQRASSHRFKKAQAYLFILGSFIETVHKALTSSLWIFIVTFFFPYGTLWVTYVELTIMVITYQNRVGNLRSVRRFQGLSESDLVMVSSLHHLSPISTVCGNFWCRGKCSFYKKGTIFMIRLVIQVMAKYHITGESQTLSVSFSVSVRLFISLWLFNLGVQRRTRMMTQWLNQCLFRNLVPILS